MARVGPVGRLSRTVDHAVRWRPGLVPVGAAPVASSVVSGVESFWEGSRIAAPAPVRVLPIERRSRGAARLLDISAESSGPGDHPGSRSVVGRVAIPPAPGAPAVLLLH